MSTCPIRDRCILCHPDALGDAITPPPVNAGTRVAAYRHAVPSVRPQRPIPTRAPPPDFHSLRLAWDAFPGVLFPVIGLIRLLYLVSRAFATVFSIHTQMPQSAFPTNPHIREVNFQTCCFKQPFMDRKIQLVNTPVVLAHGQIPLFQYIISLHYAMPDSAAG